jgi:hypothetical protein
MVSKYCQPKISTNLHKKTLWNKTSICQSTTLTQTDSQPKECFSNCKLIPNIRENHSYIPLNSNTIRVFQVSGSCTLRDTSVLRQYSEPTYVAHTSPCTSTLPAHMVESCGSVFSWIKVMTVVTALSNEYILKDHQPSFHWPQKDDIRLKLKAY